MKPRSSGMRSGTATKNLVSRSENALKTQDHAQELVFWSDSKKGEVFSCAPGVGIGSNHLILLTAP